MKKVILSSFVLASLVFTSCSNDDDTTGGEVTTVTAPETYAFENESGESTVSFSGQTIRLRQGDEFVAALKDNTKTLAELEAMFAHSAGDADFDEEALNTASNQIRSKIGDSVDYFSSNATEAVEIQEDFDAWIAAQVNEVFPSWSVDAEAGVAGAIAEFGGTTRYVNAKGYEYDQLINKGLIGALTLDQIINDYTSPNLLDKDTFTADNTAGTVVEGKTYTQMEHYWDEGYGYLFGDEVDPASPAFEGNVDSFLNKYLDRVDDDSDFDTFEEEVYEAFKLGRAAIVAADYDLRDEQIAIIKDRLSQVIGVRAVYYLKAGQAILESDGLVDYGSAFHDISEGLGFIYSLRFTQKADSVEPYFTKAEVDAYIDDLVGSGSTNGLWDADTATKLETIAEEIAAEFDFTVEEAQTID